MHGYVYVSVSEVHDFPLVINCDQRLSRTVSGIYRRDSAKEVENHPTVVWTPIRGGLFKFPRPPIVGWGDDPF